MDVVVVLAGIVEERLVLAEGAFEDLLDRLVLPLGALGQIVSGRHIGLMMLVVMEFEGLARHVRRESVISIRQIG